jgi:hypothetical protein
MAFGDTRPAWGDGWSATNGRNAARSAQGSWAGLRNDGPLALDGMMGRLALETRVREDGYGARWAPVGVWNGGGQPQVQRTLNQPKAYQLSALNSSTSLIPRSAKRGLVTSPIAFQRILSLFSPSPLDGRRPDPPNRTRPQSTPGLYTTGSGNRLFSRALNSMPRTYDHRRHR